MKKVVLKKNKVKILENCFVASNFFARFLGLMGKKTIPKNFGLYFPKCNSIHTFFMRTPIDVVFLNKEGQITALQKAMRPWRMVSPKKNVRDILEMGAGEIDRLKFSIGDTLELGEMV